MIDIDQIAFNELKEVKYILNVMLNSDILSVDDVVLLYALMAKECEVDQFIKRTPIPIFYKFLLKK